MIFKPDVIVEENIDGVKVDDLIYADRNIFPHANLMMCYEQGQDLGLIYIEVGVVQ